MKNQIQSENKNWKIIVSLLNQEILFNKNLQNEILEKIIIVGINRNQIILKNKINQSHPEFQFNEKNKIDKINKCNKKKENIFNGVKTTTFSHEIYWIDLYIA